MADFWLIKSPQLFPRVYKPSLFLALLRGATLSQHYIWPILALLSFLERDILKAGGYQSCQPFEVGLKPKRGRILA